jgi:hypothetical protein
MTVKELIRFTAPRVLEDRIARRQVMSFSVSSAGSRFACHPGDSGAKTFHSLCRRISVPRRLSPMTASSGWNYSQDMADRSWLVVRRLRLVPLRSDCNRRIDSF